MSKGTDRCGASLRWWLPKKWRNSGRITPHVKSSVAKLYMGFSENIQLFRKHKQWGSGYSACNIRKPAPLSHVTTWKPASGARWVVWDDWCLKSGMKWVVWDECREMSGMRWVVWDECCEMSSVRWAVWDEWCVMSGGRSVVWKHMDRTRRWRKFPTVMNL